MIRQLLLSGIMFRKAKEVVELDLYPQKREFVGFIESFCVSPFLVNLVINNYSILVLKLLMKNCCLTKRKTCVLLSDLYI